MEITVDDTLVTIHINPYYLRLNFSHGLLEDEASSATYDPGSSYLTVTLTKKTKGQEFKDLDLLAKLLAPRSSQPLSSGPLIEVIGSEANPSEEEDDLVEGTQKLTLEQQEILEGVRNSLSTSMISLNTV